MRPDFIPSFVREDGTFCIVTKYKQVANAENLRQPVNEWCDQWVAKHEKMKPLLLDSTREDDETEYWHYYYAIFKTPPYVVKAENDQLWVRFDGTYSMWWRDWFVSIMNGLTSTFPALKAENSDIVYDCAE
jgi:hypothetical protein